jgi:hypothetical protein
MKTKKFFFGLFLFITCGFLLALVATAQYEECWRYDSNDYLYNACANGIGGSSTPLDAQFVSQSVTATMIAGQTYSVSVTMKNTGTTSWTESSQIRLGEQNSNPIWGGRISLASGETIASGQTKTFTFSVKAPTAPGTYNFQWRMLQENVQWFGQSSTNVAVVVTAPPLDSQFVSQSVPTKMTAGQTYSVSVTMKNTGTTSWTESSQIRLGEQNSNPIWGGRISLASGETIASGQTKTFTFSVKAPTAPGTYNFQWRMLQEGVTWFGQTSTNVAVTVAAGSYPGTYNITVTSQTDGITEKSIGANEGDGLFNISDLVDAGVKNYRIYSAPNRFIWDSEGWSWGSVTIDQIKANPNIIDWTKWEAALRDTKGYATGLPGNPVGSLCSSNADCQSKVCNINGVCSWRYHGHSLYQVLTALKTNSITPVLSMANYWQTAQWGDTSKGWGSPPAGMGVAPPKTQADYNELWERTFASVYVINVKNNLNVNDWEISNEPDGTFPGTVADYVKFSQTCYDAIKYVYDKYLPGQTFRFYDPATAGAVLSGAVSYLTESIKQNSSRISVIDWHNYDSTFSSDATKIRNWLRQYGAGDKEVYLSEWGDWQGEAGIYTLHDNAITYAKYLMGHSASGDGRVDQSSIFSLYDWVKSGYPGLISASAAKTPSYYAFRIVTRGLQGGKQKYRVSGVPSGTNMIAAKEGGTLYLTMLNEGYSPQVLNIDASAHASSASVGIREFTSAKNDTVGSSITLNSGKFTVTLPARSIILASVPLASGAVCANECQTSGAKQCSGNGYKTCGNYDSDSCLEWSSGVTACPSGQTCQNGQCVASCTPDCSGKTCGDNGCGGTCGTCASGKTCSAGVCVADCVPKTCSALVNYTCGSWPDGCGNTIDCGTCESGKSCSAGKCASHDAKLPAVTIKANNSTGVVTVDSGQLLSLSWDSTQADTCLASDGWSGNLSASGTQFASTDASKTYTITCTNSYGSWSDSVTVNISSDSTSQTDDLAALYAQIEYLQNEIARVQGLLAARNSPSISCTQLTKNLYYGMTNDPEVKCLQEFLKAQGLFDGPVTGNFYNLTKTAVIAFQEKYSSEILTPLGLTRGTGIVAGNTRAKINALMTI